MIIKDLSSQSEVVIRQLVQEHGMTEQEAKDTWYNSKTKAELEKYKLFFASGMRCYWELTLELTGDSRWMNTSFE